MPNYGILLPTGGAPQTTVSIPLATATEPGLLSAADKRKLDAICLMARATPQTSHLSDGDHVVFNQASLSKGDSITLDTTSPYTSAPGVPSIGRFTLAGGLTYRIGAVLALVVFSAPSYLQVVWYDVDSESEISSEGYLRSPDYPGRDAWSGDVECYFAPTSTRRIELRLATVGGPIETLGSGGSLLQAMIEVIG